jgi:hypothetical protein
MKNLEQLSNTTLCRSLLFGVGLALVLLSALPVVADVAPATESVIVQASSTARASALVRGIGGSPASPTRAVTGTRWSKPTIRFTWAPICCTRRASTATV